MSAGVVQPDSDAQKKIAALAASAQAANAANAARQPPQAVKVD
jgi:hypothetical protein